MRGDKSGARKRAVDSNTIVVGEGFCLWGIFPGRYSRLILCGSSSSSGDSGDGAAEDLESDRSCADMDMEGDTERGILLA